MSRATKAVILARVSTEEQEEGYSIDAQTNRLTEYCIRKKLEVLETFKVTESSTKGDRQKFFAMVKAAQRLSKQRKEPIAIIADKIDRVQRSFNEMPVLDNLRKQGVIELHFNTDNCVLHKDSPANEIFMWNISIALAQNYTDSLRDNVKRSINQKLKQGEWISQAPIGYLHAKDPNTGKSDIVLDPDRAHLVKKLFEIYATGDHSFEAMTQFAKKIGLRNSRGNKGELCRSHMVVLLRDPFYHGVMHVKKRGEYYPHRYETIISKELFDQCEDVRTGRRRYVGNYNSIDFLFKGMLTCAVTGRTVSSERAKRTYKSGKTAEWIYLSTWNPDNPSKKVWVREDAIVEQVKEALQSIAIPNEKILKEVITYIHKTQKSKQHAHRSETADLKREHTDIEEKLDTLIELMIAGRIADEDYQKKHRKLKGRQTEITNELRVLDNVDGKFSNHLEYLVKVANGAADYFGSSEPSRKRDILKYVFQNLHLRGKNLEYSMAFPFNEFAKCAKNGDWLRG